MDGRPTAAKKLWAMRVVRAAALSLYCMPVVFCLFVDGDIHDAWLYYGLFPMGVSRFLVGAEAVARCGGGPLLWSGHALYLILFVCLVLSRRAKVVLSLVGILLLALALNIAGFAGSGRWVH